ncbi:class F sortase [Nocardioides humi]
MHDLRAAVRRPRLLVPAILLAVALAGTVAPEPAGAAERRVRAGVTCTAPSRPFTPTTATIPAIDRSTTVVRVRRTAKGAVGAPPVSKRGKWLLGRDPQARPGEGEGTVIMTAHTWPDGTALGNALLRSLRKGGRVVLGNKAGTEAACYQVTRRKRYAAARVPRKKAFRWWGPEQLVIVVCSGKRLGPGHWSHRTVWYAVPVPVAS